MTASELLAPFSRSHFFQKPHPASSLALLLPERMEVAAWAAVLLAPQPAIRVRAQAASAFPFFRPPGVPRPWAPARLSRGFSFICL